MEATTDWQVEKGNSCTPNLLIAMSGERDFGDGGSVHSVKTELLLPKDALDDHFGVRSHSSNLAVGTRVNLSA
jgi:hypothetical protein